MSYRSDFKYSKSIAQRVKAEPSCEITAAEYEEWKAAMNRIITRLNRRAYFLKTYGPSILYGMSVGFVVAAFGMAFHRELLPVIAWIGVAAEYFYLARWTTKRLSGVKPLDLIQ